MKITDMKWMQNQNFVHIFQKFRIPTMILHALNLNTLKWSKMAVKAFIMLQKSSISNKSFHQMNRNKEQQSSMLEWFLKDHVTEDWSNDAENTAAHHGNKLYLSIYSNRKQYFKIFDFYI